MAVMSVLMEPISPILFSLFRGSPRHAEWVVACLQGAWPGLLGPKLAAVCRPCLYENRRLVIEVLDRAWEDPLRACEPELLAKIRTATSDEVRTLAFRPASS
jgi:hypothetical protein